jgi:hypothetical protein
MQRGNLRSSGFDNKPFFTDLTGSVTALLEKPQELATIPSELAHSRRGSTQLQALWFTLLFSPTKKGPRNYIAHPAQQTQLSVFSKASKPYLQAQLQSAGPRPGESVQTPCNDIQKSNMVVGLMSTRFTVLALLHWQQIHQH